MSKNENYDPVTIAGVIACSLAILLIFWYNSKRVVPTAADNQQEVIVYPQTDSKQPGTSATTVESDSGTVSPEATSTQYDPYQASKEPEKAAVQLELSGDLIANVDPEGGGISTVELLQHFVNKSHENNDNGKKVELGNYDYPFLALNARAAGLVLQKAEIITHNKHLLHLSRKSADESLQIEEKWRIIPDADCQLAYSIKIKNLSDQPKVLSHLMLDAGALPSSISAKRKSSSSDLSGGVSYFEAGSAKVKSLKLKALNRKMTQELRGQLATTPAAWVAVHSKYFLFFLRLNDNKLFSGIEASAVNGFDYSQFDNPNAAQRMQARAILPSINLEKGEVQNFDFSAYVGPKDFKKLRSIGFGLASIMEMNRFFFWNLSWMGWLSRIMLSGMVLISGIFPANIGYGMGIVGVTLVVKLLFWPLNYRSTVSMRKMSALNPELKKLREKYKDDPQKMYRKQQELFKANKVSQLGGCMPMLFQIPVFFALFNTFRNAIELRHAGFLWAIDLSMPDDLFFSLFGLPIRPLALLMGASMYLQQRMTPSPDPNQAKMMSMMSFVFIFMFYGMPSALTLYMTVNQLLTIIQMLVIKKFEDKNGQATSAIVIP